MPRERLSERKIFAVTTFRVFEPRYWGGICVQGAVQWQKHIFSYYSHQKCMGLSCTSPILPLLRTSLLGEGI
jgi:hypothetical protein